MSENSQHFDPEPAIASVLAGDKDQFRLLVREYGLLVRSFIAARLYHQEDVEDLAQEVFVTAFERLDTYEPGNFRGWLMGIAKNHLLNHWRKVSRRADAMERFRHEITTVIETELEAEHDDLQPGQIELLLDCIARLPERARRIIHAGLDGTRAETLADEIKMKPNAIYQARHRAHAALRKCMEHPQPG